MGVTSDPLVQLRAVRALVHDAPQLAAQELWVAEEAARHGLVDMRGAINDLRGTVVQDLGLANALAQLASRSGIATTFRPSDDEPPLRVHEAQILYLIAQEALRNVERHAQAATVAVTLASDTRRGPACQLVIYDDGVGFDSTGLGDGHFGIRGMHERADLIGARLQVESAPGRGTLVSVVLEGGRADD